ncbi:MAG TPA: thioredoxin-disulfide reductase [Candidatus Marinimicrobia bacterium]|nr:thioredoxin-disulfide reductase [Candidatus Neomarinimicrobiota bacterium]
MTDKVYDVIIIGGGPAGFTSSIYTAREKLDTLLLEKSMTGGIPNVTDLIENYPGFPEGIAGPELMQKFRRQAERFNVIIKEYDEAGAIIPGKEYHTVKTEKKGYLGKTVIIATGGLPRLLNVPGEEELTGRGVSYCATCDGPFYKDAEIVVVGGGDAAIQEALFLTKFASKVTVIHRRDQLRASPILQQRAFDHKQIDFIWDSVVTEISGENLVEAIKIKNVKSGKISTKITEGVFIFIGWTPNTDFVKDLVKLDEEGHIVTDRYMHTNVKGIFAVGDVRSKKFRQIAEAVGDGTVGALAVSEYIDGLA